MSRQPVAGETDPRWGMRGPAAPATAETRTTSSVVSAEAINSPRSQAGSRTCANPWLTLSFDDGHVARRTRCLGAAHLLKLGDGRLHERLGTVSEMTREAELMTVCTRARPGKVSAFGDCVRRLPGFSCGPDRLERPPTGPRNQPRLRRHDNSHSPRLARSRLRLVVPHPSPPGHGRTCKTATARARRPRGMPDWYRHDDVETNANFALRLDGIQRRRGSARLPTLRGLGRAVAEEGMLARCGRAPFLSARGRTGLVRARSTCSSRLRVERSRTATVP